jgi:hypothetical protein
VSAPVALWPAGFKERKQQHADAIVASDAAPSPLERVAAMFPDAMEIAAKALGLAHLPDWALIAAQDALAACIASVTIETAGTVTVVDHRTGPA